MVQRSVSTALVTAAAAALLGTAPTLACDDLATDAVNHAPTVEFRAPAPAPGAETVAFTTADYVPSRDGEVAYELNLNG